MNKKINRLLKGALAFTVAFSTLAVTTSTSRSVSAVEQEESYTQYVDPFVCTDVDYGQLFPGSVVPNGLVKLSPDTYPHNTLDHAGYDYSKLQIQGFSHTRIEGVGGQGAGGDVLVTPTYVEYSQRPQAQTRAMNYTKEDESAKPGYYSVELTPKTGKDNDVKDSPEIGKIKAEMTTDQRTGFHRYTFPEAGSVNIITDLNYTYHGTDIRNAYVDVLEQSDTTTAIGGRFSGRNVSGNGKYTMYFYMETSKPANSVKTWNDTTLSDKTSQKGNDIGTIMNFDVEENEEIQLKVSISPISVKQAKIDMHNEIDDWDFDATASRADQAWNDVLSKVRVESSEVSDPTGELKQLFYTHLYHMFMTPVNATSTSGTFRGTDGKIHEANDYTHYDSWTLWDDYRKYPMIGLIQPDTYKDMVKSIADALDYGIVTWSHDKQPVPNVRTEHAVALLADGVAKGFTDIDNLEEAYEEAKEIVNEVITSEVEEIGYVPNRVDRTIEYGYDDWCLSIIAEALGKEDEAAYFLDRSFNYKNTFRKDAVDSPFSDKKLGLLWNRDSNGNWLNQDPSSTNTGLYQGTMWQYTWYGSNDVNGLMDLMGGREATLEALMYMFGMQDPDDPRGMQHNAANEVELHTPYLFNFVGRPDLTQHWVREIYTRETWNSNYASGTQTEKQKMYKLSPQGYLETMDDDAGTMAMMFVSAAMGIFPMTPGDTTFQIGSPFFEKVTLDVGNGKTFTIEANNVSDTNEYIQSATLNGKSFDRTWVDYSEITRGGVLSFEMGDTPSTWAQNGVTAKSSSDNADTSTYDDDEIAYSSAMFEESKANDGSFDQKITITLKTKEFAGEIGEDLVATGKINITNVPEGLEASAIKTEANKVEVSLNGKAKNHTLNDSISNLTIEITDAATNEPITDSIRKTKDNVKVMFIDNQLTYSQSEFKESESDDGAILETSTITLTGDATFAGEIGEDLVATGKINITNVPEGLTAKMIKIDDHTVVLSFEGKAVNNEADVEIELAFADSAFNGALASEIDQSSRGGMTALLLDFDYDHTSKLKRTMAEATYINASAYTQSSYQAVLDAVAKGQELLDNENATSKEIDLAIGDIIDAQEQLDIPRDGFSVLQAESSDATSGGSLRVEGSVLHGTYDGAWIRYDALDFNGLNPKYLELRYDNASNRCASDSHLEVRLDGVDGTLIGDIQLPATGTAWGSYETLQFEISNPELLDGKHDVYFVFKGTTEDSRPYVAKVDYLQFKETADIDSVKLEAEKSDENSGNGLKNESINLGGTYDGAWIKYNNVNFNNLEADTINVHYSTRVDACALDARIEIRKDNKDGELLGTIMLPLTGGWSDYQTVSTKLDTSVTGVQDICFVLRGTNDGGRPYVANIDYMEFVNSGVNHIEAENKDDWSGAELKVENSTDNTGKSLTNIGGARNDAWLRYNGVEFNGKTEMTVRYSHNPGTAGTQTGDLRLGHRQPRRRNRGTFHRRPQNAARRVGGNPEGEDERSPPSAPLFRLQQNAGQGVRRKRHPRSICNFLHLKRNHLHRIGNGFVVRLQRRSGQHLAGHRNCAWDTDRQRLRFQRTVDRNHRETLPVGGARNRRTNHLPEFRLRNKPGHFQIAEEHLPGTTALMPARFDGQPRNVLQRDVIDGDTGPFRREGRFGIGRRTGRLPAAAVAQFQRGTGAALHPLHPDLAGETVTVPGVGRKFFRGVEEVHRRVIRKLRLQNPVRQFPQPERLPGKEDPGLLRQQIPFQLGGGKLLRLGEIAPRHGAGDLRRQKLVQQITAEQLYHKVVRPLEIGSFPVAHHPPRLVHILPVVGGEHLRRVAEQPQPLGIHQRTGQRGMRFEIGVELGDRKLKIGRTGLRGMVPAALQHTTEFLLLFKQTPLEIPAVVTVHPNIDVGNQKIELLPQHRHHRIVP